MQRLEKHYLRLLQVRNRLQKVMEIVLFYVNTHYLGSALYPPDTASIACPVFVLPDKEHQTSSHDQDTTSIMVTMVTPVDHDRTTCKFQGWKTSITLLRMIWYICSPRSKKGHVSEAGS